MMRWFPLFFLPDHFCVLLYHLDCFSFLPVFFVLFLFFCFSCWNLHFWLDLFMFSFSFVKFCVHLFFSLIQLEFFLLIFWILYLVSCLLTFHYLIFSGFFFCSFNWDHFFCLLILLNFLCLYEFRWNRYLLWSRRAVLMWKCTYTVCVCPVALVGELDFMWTQVMSFLRVCWQMSPTLVGGGDGDGGARAWARRQVGLPLCSVAVTALSRVGSDPKLLEYNPWGSSPNWLCSF